MAKMIKSFLLNFLDTHFEIKKTSDNNEIRINSIYENDKSYHLYINLDKGVFTDFKTSVSGGVERLIADYLDIPTSQVSKHLIEEYSLRNEDDTLQFLQEEIEESKNELVLPKGLKYFSEVKDGIIRNKAYRYLEKRKISKEIIDELGYIYSGDSDFNERIFIPFYESGKLVYFLARDFTGNNKVRYKNPSGINSKEFVYNVDNIKEEVVICEGIIDALSLDNQIAVPLMSADIGKIQVVKILDKEPKRVIIVPDNDETGARTLAKNIALIYEYKPPSVKIELRVFRLPKDCKDLNDMKINTGKNFVSFDECEEYSSKNVDFKFSRKKIEL